MRRLQVAFIVILFAVLCVPSLGMIWAPTTSTTENRTLAELPAPALENGTANINYLSKLGTYFDDHFAYRNELVAMNAKLRVGSLGVSPANDVVVGRGADDEDWLYYQGTLNDFSASNLMSDEELLKSASNLAKMQSITEANGAKFLFVIAPNKNSLYPENMPAYYLAADVPNNSERIIPYLRDKKVNYLNLFEVLRRAKSENSENPENSESTERLLYFKTDSHWNNRGALIASNAICESLGAEPLDNPSEWTSRTDHMGDLESMLYPTFGALETDSYYGGINDEENLTGASWSYTNDAQSTFDETITTSGMGSASMLVYRDSFGNALLPYLATQSSEAYFSRLVPYDTDLISELKPDYVIVERAERHLDFFADDPLL